MSAYSSVPYTRRAAVLILLFSDRKGKADSPLETPLETARREAQEEIGLPSNDAQLPPPFRLEHLCQLPTNLAKTELAVCPCVAFIHSGDDNAWNDADVETNLIPTLDAREVAVVFTAPFHNFLMVEDEVNTEEAHTTDGDKSIWYTGSWTSWHETPWRMHNFHVPVVGQSVRRAKEISADESQEIAAEQFEKSGEVGASRRYRVFGMTARILVDAARVAYGQEPEFEHNSHFGDEDMIRRLQKMGRFTEKRTSEDDLRKEDLVKAAKI
ncbi:MAG: hypothetical protein M1835_008034 [Candelina submexicana]|nr:MAG: hypothetical protein M1835_008034 [Candelina submexicana]